MPKGTPEMFYRTIQFWDDVNAPPVFVYFAVRLFTNRTVMVFIFCTFEETVSISFSLQR